MLSHGADQRPVGEYPHAGGNDHERCAGDGVVRQEDSESQSEQRQRDLDDRRQGHQLLEPASIDCEGLVEYVAEAALA